MRDLPLRAVRLLVTVAKRLRASSVRALPVESLLFKQQIITGNRSRRANLIKMPRASALLCLDRKVKQWQQ